MSYSPTIGRFLERDPLGYPEGMNPYEAYRSNPVNRLDPLGLASVGELESTVADLQARLDYDWNANGGKAGPNNQALWEALQKAKAELDELKGENWGEFEKIAGETVSCEACKKGKEAAEFDCVNKIANRAGQLAGVAGAGNAAEIGGGAVVGVLGGYVAVNFWNPTGWAVGGGMIVVGGVLTVKGVWDAAGTAEIVNQGRRAAEQLCKCK